MGAICNYIRAWLATVLISRGDYQEAKGELEKSGGNMGHKRKRPSIDEILKCKKRKKILFKSKNMEHIKRNIENFNMINNNVQKKWQDKIKSKNRISF